LLLVFWVGIPLIADLSGLVLTNKRLSHFYQSTKYIVVPAAFLLTLFKTLKKNSAWHIEMRTILLTVTAALFSVLIFMFGFYDDLCGSTTKRTLFINHQVPSSRIFLREFGCGAANAGERQEVVRVDTIFGILIRVTEIDTTKLNRNKWMRQPD